MPISRIETASLDSALVAPTATALTTASGSAPSYSARAWVNFNGTGTVAIRASGNVSSITDNGVGNYRVNFTTAMSDANYSAVASDGNYGLTNVEPATANTAYTNVYSYNINGSLTDTSGITVAIFR